MYKETRVYWTQDESLLINRAIAKVLYDTCAANNDWDNDFCLSYKNIPVVHKHIEEDFNVRNFPRRIAYEFFILTGDPYLRISGSEVKICFNNYKRIPFESLEELSILLKDIVEKIDEISKVRDSVIKELKQVLTKYNVENDYGDFKND